MNKGQQTTAEQNQSSVSADCKTGMPEGKERL